MPPQKNDLKPPPVLRTEEVDAEKPIGDQNEFARHTPEQTGQLAQDIAANGLLQSIAVTEDWRVIFGHGRLLAVRKLGWKTIRAAIYPKGLSEVQFRLIRAAENLHRNELTAYRKWQLCVELLCGNVGWDQQTLAEHLHLSQATVTKMLSPSKCTEEWQQALKEEKVGISDCYAASRLPLDKQGGLLALKLAGATRDELEQVVKPRTQKPETVKVSRIVCPLTTGVTLTVQGKDIDLEALIQSLQTAIEAARKGLKEQIDVKTWSRVMADKAKAV